MPRSKAEMQIILSTGLKVCKQCNQEKPLNDYNKSSRHIDGKRSSCRECDQKNNSTEHAKKLQLVHDLKPYGLSLEQFDALLEQQNYVCKICGGDNSSCKRRLAVDHDHLTGEVRGLLCNACNSLLANAKDKIEILMKAIIYLQGAK